MKPIIEVNGLWKEYQRGAQKEKYLSLRDQVFKSFKPGVKKDTFNALEDINFEVFPGDSLAIIGKNGAGKSTLLKILSKITPPTKGEIILRGRLASLLEVGTGFHAELTGRENVYLNGSILGLSKTEINRQFDAIVDFSGVEVFLDTPLKHYSSGMQLRLAFAVAAHLEPEILVIDEVLAVGDSEFQKKCLGKMSEVSQSGRTIVFVSHNTSAITNLTKTAILLQNGRCILSGSTDKVLSSYLNDESNNETLWQNTDLNNGSSVRQVELLLDKGHNLVLNGESLKIKFTIYVADHTVNPCLSFQIIDELEKPIIHCWNFDYHGEHGLKSGLNTLICTIPELKLYMGNYRLNVFFSEPPGGRFFNSIQGICPFQIALTEQRRDFPFRKDDAAYTESFVWKNLGSELTGKRTFN